MDAVIITGASGEPALSIARRLCGLGIRVYALAGTVPETGLSAEEFVPVPCDLTSPDSVISAVGEILEKEPHVSGLVLAGQYLSDECFEAVSAEEIRLAFNAQTVSPLCAVRLVLPSVIAARGHVVVVSPGAGTAEARALNAAADGAMRAFTAALFAELRDTGVKTCHILLQNNAGTPDPAARFTTAPQSRIHADIVADAVETVFRLRENNALTQMILRPQATRETPRIPVSAEPKIRALQSVQLPPAKNFPPEEEPIPTPAYRRPDYAPAKVDLPAGEREDEDGFADDYVDPELRHLVKNPPPQNRPQQQQPRGNAEPPRRDGAENAGQQNSRRERNRRRKRNRRNRDGAMRITPPQFDAPQQQQQPQPRRENENVPARAESVPAVPASSRADAPTDAAPAAANVPAAAEEKTRPQPPIPQTENAPADSTPAPEKPLPEKTLPQERVANVPASADRDAVPANGAPASPQEEAAPAAEKKERVRKAPRKPRSESAPRRPRKRKPPQGTEPPSSPAAPSQEE